MNIIKTYILYNRLKTGYYVGQLIDYAETVLDPETFVLFDLSSGSAGVIIDEIYKNYGLQANYSANASTPFIIQVARVSKTLNTLKYQIPLVENKEDINSIKAQLIDAAAPEIIIDPDPDQGTEDPPVTNPGSTNKILIYAALGVLALFMLSRNSK